MTSRTNETNASPTLRERAIDAYDGARERASAATATTGERIAEAPLLALGGGLALGALIGALLPRSRAEERLLGNAGSKITDGARTAFDAAKEAGREKLAELNITRDAGANAVQSLVEGLSEAARTSGQAAVEAVRKRD